MDPSGRRRWASYYASCRARNEKPTDHPRWIPRPLPGNEDIYEAYKMVGQCRLPSFGGAPPFNWSAIESRLKLHGLWTPKVERGLARCETITRNIENRLIEEERLRQKARSKNAGAKSRR